MKILFYIESLGFGGKERRLVELIKALSKDKTYQMEIVLTRKRVHYKEIFSTNVKIIYLERKSIKKDPTIFYKFYKIAKNFKPDIIHTWGNLTTIYSILSKIVLRIPLINNQITDAPSKVSNSILGHKITFRFSDRIIANSFAGLRAYNAPKEKSCVIYNGFDFGRISYLEDIDLVKEKFNISTKYIIGMVASFTNKKDYASYIKAANMVLKKGKSITFLCIGSGDSTEYEKMVEKENIGKILFLGKQNNVESIMNICDIGVLSTYTEGISNALLEFSALSKPIISTFGGGNQELVKQGETGYLINQESPHEMVEKILLLLSDKNMRKKFGKKGRERIEKEFSIEKMITKFSNAYEEVITERNNKLD